MCAAAWAQLTRARGVLAISTPLLGIYMAKVYGGGKAPGDRVFHPIERLIYRVAGSTGTVNSAGPPTRSRSSPSASRLLMLYVSGCSLLPLNPTDAPRSARRSRSTPR